MPDHGPTNDESAPHGYPMRGASVCRLLLFVGFLKLPGVRAPEATDLLAVELDLGLSHIDSLSLHQLGVVRAGVGVDRLDMQGS
jgi:hypothetical protein